MIVSFRDRGSEDIFNGLDTKAARRTCPRSVWPAARRRLDAVDYARDILDLRHLGLEKLKGDRDGQHSIRINGQYRICFVWLERDAEHVEVVDYH